MVGSVVGGAFPGPGNALARTPGPQVSLYKARSGIELWSSEGLEPRIPQIVNEARHQSTSKGLGVRG